MNCAGINSVRVLIAEDYPDTAEVFEMFLRQMGFADVDAARDGEEAVRMFDAAVACGQPYGLFIVDLAMPAVDGFSFIEHVRRFDAVSPAIVITGYPQHATRGNIKRSGATTALYKPVEPTKFERAVRGVLGYVAA